MPSRRSTPSPRLLAVSALSTALGLPFLLLRVSGLRRERVRPRANAAAAPARYRGRAPRYGRYGEQVVQLQGEGNMPLPTQVGCPLGSAIGADRVGAGYVSAFT